MNMNVLIIILTVCTIVSGLYNLKLHADANLWKEKVNLYRNRYQYRSGWTTLEGGFSYNLFTNDGGEHWYATRDGIIWGLADEVHPGLVEHLEAWDVIMRYVEINGPITLGSQHEIKLLERAGFSVESR